jgi:hypothetical protein
MIDSHRRELGPEPFKYFRARHGQQEVDPRFGRSVWLEPASQYYRVMVALFDKPFAERAVEQADFERLSDFGLEHFADVVRAMATQGYALFRVELVCM